MARVMSGLNLLTRLSSVKHVSNKSFSTTAVVQMDPVQKLFLDTVKEYKVKSAKSGGKPVDAGADYEKMKTDAIDRLAKIYNVGDPKTFPTFKFVEPNLDQDEVEAN